MAAPSKKLRRKRRKRFRNITENAGQYDPRFFYIKQVAFVKCREVWTALAKRGHASSWNLMLNNPRGPGAPALKPNNPLETRGFCFKVSLELVAAPR